MKKHEIQKEFFSLSLKKLKENWKVDLISGFLVFLIALPLSLGIAMASSFPPMAGIIAAVVGGMVVAIFSGSHLTICGPAAGLIVVIIHGVDVLGAGDPMLGYRTTLAAIVIAGFLQIFFGIMKSGKLSTFFPGAVVHAMMAAIGIIIMSKQVHTMLGVKPQGKEIFDIIFEIPKSFMNLNPQIALIGIVSLLMLIFIPKIPFKWIKKIPVPMLVVLAGIMFDKILDLEHEHLYQIGNASYQVGPKFLLQLPKNLADGIVFPDWRFISNFNFWVVTFSIALVASLETLLSASAIQSVDPQRRKANFDKDLVALGSGTVVSGFFGGLPMIAEIVRSSANVSNGAKTPWSNFFHGFFMLVFVLGLPGLLQEIPLASLAALLVFVGWRLASPKEFIKIYKIGMDQLIIFIATIVMTLMTDLLIGVGFGILVKLLIHSMRGLSFKEIFFTNVITQKLPDGEFFIKVNRAAVFWSIYKLKDTLYNLKEPKMITINFSMCKMVDHSMMEFLEHYKVECIENGIDLNIEGIQHLKVDSHHHQATRHL